jgi:hypothetical protein
MTTTTTGTTFPAVKPVGNVVPFKPKPDMQEVFACSACESQAFTLAVTGLVLCSACDEPMPLVVFGWNALMFELVNGDGGDDGDVDA